MGIETIIVAAVPSILSGVVLVVVNKANKKSEQRENLRKRESFLILTNIDAIGDLAYQTARCHKGEKPNGELSQAMEYREQQKRALDDHLKMVSVEQR